MASLGRVFGTEEDKVNCPFYYKTGACRHGDRCGRMHHKPVESPTLLMHHLYQNPMSVLIAQGIPREHGPSERELQEQFEDFYCEIFDELAKFGELDELAVCDNLNDHLVGNVYAKYVDVDSAEAALNKLAGRFYAGRPIMAEYCIVTDFRDSRCRKYEESQCDRGGYCNFMHLKSVSRRLRRDLFENQPHATSKSRNRSKSRSKSRRHRSRSRSPARRGRDDRRDTRRRDDRHRSSSHRRDDRDDRRRRDDRDKDHHRRHRDDRHSSSRHRSRSPARSAHDDAARTNGGGGAGGGAGAHGDGSAAAAPAPAPAPAQAAAPAPAPAPAAAAGGAQ